MASAQPGQQARGTGEDSSVGGADDLGKRADTSNIMGTTGGEAGMAAGEHSGGQDVDVEMEENDLAAELVSNGWSESEGRH